MPGVPSVLIVEDEMLVAALMTELVEELGCQVIGPASDVDEALQIAGQTDVDFAVLDINIAGKPSYPVAETLQRRGIPFVFTTGYTVDHIDKTYGCPVISKPFDSTYMQSVAAGQLGLAMPSR
jgi:CheY-like chemotaxis protein